MHLVAYLYEDCHNTWSLEHKVYPVALWVMGLSSLLRQFHHFEATCVGWSSTGTKWEMGGDVEEIGQRNESWRIEITNGSHEWENGVRGIDGPVEKWWS